MSEWTGWSEFAVESRSADLLPIGEGRPAGLHLGSVIQAMRVAAGERSGDIPGEAPWLRAQVGFLWEQAVEYMLGGVPYDDAMELAFKRHMVAGVRKGVVKQFRLEADGIHMTPDGLDPAVPQLESYKLTWKGAGKATTLEDFEDNFWNWHVAEKGYARNAGVLSCRFIVLWVRGDYKGAQGPMARECTVRWTQDELEANWNVVLAQAAALKAREGR